MNSCIAAIPAAILRAFTPLVRHRQAVAIPYAPFDGFVHFELA